MRHYSGGLTAKTYLEGFPRFIDWSSIGARSTSRPRGSLTIKDLSSTRSGWNKRSSYALRAVSLASSQGQSLSRVSS
jgi:hypothetical protein